ncbi:member of S.t1.c1p complex histone methyl transferase [Penicillium verhagenii]|nr:member of S.t1.c1p complex histone methyl transferase [Penicillium verhagenii]
MADSQAQTQPQQPSEPEELTTQTLPEMIRTYRPIRTFKGSKPNSSTHVTSLDFDDQGNWLVASGDDDALQIFDIQEGTLGKPIPSKKYGAHLARFTHSHSSILHASTKVDDNLRLLDVHNESYIRYFNHHKDTVTSLALSPSGDQFVSSGKDDTVAVWDLASRNPQGKLKLATPYLVAFDPSASVLAIASQSTVSVLLYDFRNYDKAPFSNFDLASLEERYTPTTRGRAWTRLEFSNDGKYLMVGTDYHGHFILDAFDGTLQAFLTGKSSSSGRAAPVSSTGKPRGQGDASFTPDGRYVIGGNGDAPDILVWDLQQKPDDNKMLHPMTRLPHRGRTSLIEYNPRFNMIASADKETVFWLPDELPKASEK